MSRWSIVRGTTETSFESLDVRVVHVAGVGLPPIEQQATAYASAAGHYESGFRVQEREITLTLLFTGATKADLHAQRKSVYHLINPHRLGVYDDAPRLRYRGGADVLDIGIVYAGGLDAATNAEYATSMMVPLRLLAIDPYWVGATDMVSCSVQEALPQTGLLYHGTNGVWGLLGQGVPNGAVYDTVESLTGKMYIGGSFTEISTPGGTVTAGGVAVYDPATDTWAGVGTTGVDGTVYALSLISLSLPFPNGGIGVVAGGDFTTVDGVASPMLAVWNEADSLWYPHVPTAAHETINGEIRRFTKAILARPANGRVMPAAAGPFCVGDFRQVMLSDDTFTIYAAVGRVIVEAWPGGASACWIDFFVQLPLVPTTHTAAAISTLDGEMIVLGGHWTEGVSSSLPYTGDPEPDYTDPQPMERVYQGATTYGRLDGGVSALCQDEMGNVYAGGVFTSDLGNPDANVTGLARWRPGGSVWERFGTALPDVQVLLYDPVSGDMIIGGDITQADGWPLLAPLSHGGPNREREATTWVPYALSLRHQGNTTTTGGLTRLKHSDLRGGLLVGLQDVGGEFLTAGETTVTNAGSATARPVIALWLDPPDSAEARVLWVENRTTGHVIWCDIALHPYETVYLDTDNQYAWSSQFGNLRWSLGPGCDLDSFVLWPGDNRIAVLATELSVSATVVWQRRYWSFDSTEVEE